MPVLYVALLLVFAALPSDATPLVCREKATEVRLAGADAVTSATIPAGWCYEETESDGISARPRDVPGVVVSLDWYHPYRDAVYEDFHARLRKEIRFIREQNADVHTRSFTHEGLPAVEVRARAKGGRRLVYTYIGFQPRGERGSLFVVLLDEPPTASDLNAYRAIVRSIRIKHE